MNFFNQVKLQYFLIPCLLLCALMLSSCSSLQAQKIQDNPNYVAEFPDENIGKIAQNITKDIFKVGDTANLTVYNVDALSNSYVVDRNGNINFPLIGTIHVESLNTAELQEILTQKYGSQYLKNPGINVKLESNEIGRVVVDGAVNNPGVFEVNDIIRLSEAIALAEGLNNIDTNGSKTFIVRNVSGERKVTEVDLRTIREFGGNDPQIIPNDVIFVQDNKGRVLFREFLRTVPLLSTAVIFATRN